MKIRMFALLFLLIAIIIPLDAKVTVSDIEYLKGENFVQLHFMTNEIMPIPEIFYPDVSNSKLIVMRIADVSFNLSKDNFRFESPIIDSIGIKKEKKFIDVEINLREKVNYRVFTNQEGLYIEFPVAKKMLSKKIPEKEVVVPPSKAKVKTEIPAPKIKKEKTFNYSKGARIKEIKVAERESDRVKFELIMSGPVDYNVLPIPQAPARLAIDLKNTKSKRIKKEINYLNVKRVRGALNSPDVFRVVFDLAYLKNYHVSVKDNIMEIEFFELPTLLSSNQKKSNKKIETIDNEKIAMLEASADPNTLNGNNGSEPKGLQQEFSESTKVPPIKSGIKKNNDFFAEEKSKVTDSDFDFQEQEIPDDLGATPGQKSYLKKTITGGKRIYTGEPMNFDFKGMDLENLILTFSKLSGLSIVIDPGAATGKTVTARMYQIPWDQAFDYFLKVNQLGMKQEGNLIRIGRISVLADEAKEINKLRQSQKLEEDLEVFHRTLSYTKVSEVEPILKRQLSPRGDILVDPRSNTLIISEIPSNVPLIDRIINVLDVSTQQVLIEARIVETFSNYTESLGIQWGYGFSADAMYGNQTSLKFPNSVNMYGNQLSSESSPLVGPLGGYAVNLPASGATSGTVFSVANVADTFRLDVALTAMQTQGKGRIISSPKTTTQNNKEAHIEQGKRIPIQISQNNTITVQYRPASLELRVTPQITAKGTVICDIEIKNNYPDFANLVKDIPPITVQAITTTVQINDGGTIVIGGMYKVEDSVSVHQTPFFGDIPLLGNLFRSKSKRAEQKELLVFITPRIVK
jgi:type IV pilus assembly protein PilQ